MGRQIILNAVLLLIVYEIFLLATATGEEPRQLTNKQIDEQCRSYADKIFKPILVYLEKSEIKEKKIIKLNSNLMEKYREIVRVHEKVMKEAFQLDEYKNKILKQQNYLQLCQNKVNESKTEIFHQTVIIEKLTPHMIFSENIVKCKDELEEKSNDLETLELQFNNINSSLNEHNKNTISSYEHFRNAIEMPTLELKLKENKAKLVEKEKEYQLCQAKVSELNATAKETSPSDCIPFGEHPGIHQIKVSGIGFIDVLCDSQAAGPGWIVIQQRIGGSESFNMDWANYRRGFGAFDEDFFLGLEKIYRLTNSRRYELYVHMVSADSKVYYAHYDEFKISDEDHGYALSSLGKFDGNAGDEFRFHEYMRFSTFDRDNDMNNRLNCADFYSSGWWYRNCYDCNLNAVYGPDLRWSTYSTRVLKEAKMLIRPKEETNK
ncbi:fibrinogen-like protein 1 [Drosophila sulfurigaster albostrigata]|uniref:fibrinogen-like protein 1 n=1 Tax=Drosophila sulfurigaster albostrigata TaxID=89887 RepID=UPI002D218C20|nr:fibrinogen-like protein 1 [Drosophila sulfurigaster albostrigata]